MATIDWARCFSGTCSRGPDVPISVSDEALPTAVQDLSLDTTGTDGSTLYCTCSHSIPCATVQPAAEVCCVAGPTAHVTTLTVCSTMGCTVLARGGACTTCRQEILFTDAQLKQCIYTNVEGLIVHVPGREAFAQEAQTRGQCCQMVPMSHVQQQSSVLASRLCWLLKHDRHTGVPSATKSSCP